MKFLQYGRVPGHLQEELVTKLKKDREHEEDGE
jgi:hypothetical protein